MARAAGATSGNASRGTQCRTGRGRPGRSMPVRFGQLSPRQIAIALEKPGLVGLKRLAHSVDIYCFRGACRLERIARPDDEIGAAACSKAADLTTHADRLSGLRGDH